MNYNNTKLFIYSFINYKKLIIVLKKIKILRNIVIYIENQLVNNYNNFFL